MESHSRVMISISKPPYQVGINVWVWAQMIFLWQLLHLMKDEAKRKRRQFRRWIPLFGRKSLQYICNTSIIIVVYIHIYDRYIYTYMFACIFLCALRSLYVCRYDKYMRIDLYDWKDTDPGILPLLVGKFGFEHFFANSIDSHKHLDVSSNGGFSPPNHPF